MIPNANMIMIICFIGQLFEVVVAEHNVAEHNK